MKVITGYAVLSKKSTDKQSAIVSGMRRVEVLDQRAVLSEVSVCWGQCFWQSPLPCYDLEDTLAAAYSNQWDGEVH